MMYKAKVAVSTKTRTKHSTQSEHRVEFLNVKPGWYVKKPLGFRRLNIKMCIISYESARRQRDLWVTPELWSLLNVALLAPRILRWFFIFYLFFLGGGGESVEPWAKH
jgi:hypothetical protein